MRMEGYKVQHCRAIRCPFESICRNCDTSSDRSKGCETQDYIINQAKNMTPTGYVYQPKEPNDGLTKIKKVKILRNETGLDLKTCKDALEYASWELPRARDYIKYGW